MTAKPSREQLPFYTRFTRLLDNPYFISDIELLRSSDVDILKSTHENVEIIEMPDGDDITNSDEIPSPLHQVMMKYNLPLIMEDFMYHYVARNEVALDKLRNGVYIVDHKSMKASGMSDDGVHNYQTWYVNDSMRDKYVEVTLAIPVHATATQITDTITQHKQFIKYRQTVANNNIPVGRVRSEYYALRDKEIMRLYDSGLPPRKIRPKLIKKWGHLTEPAISNIIYRRKKQRQNLSR